jgi:hypothetical protein
MHMKTSLYLKHTILAMPLLFAASFAFAPAQAADLQPGKRAAGPAALAEPGIAAGAAEDTLEACMARIPQNASLGQRMIAEQGCTRDESDRTQFRPSLERLAPENTSHN